MKFVFTKKFALLLFAAVCTYYSVEAFRDGGIFTGIVLMGVAGLTLMVRAFPRHRAITTINGELLAALGEVIDPLTPWDEKGFDVALGLSDDQSTPIYAAFTRAQAALEVSLTNPGTINADLLAVYNDHLLAACKAIVAFKPPGGDNKMPGRVVQKLRTAIANAERG